MDQDQRHQRLLTLALELAAEGVTGRAAVLALAGAGRGQLEAIAAARSDCKTLAEGGYPHAARALTLLAMTVHPAAALSWSTSEAPGGGGPPGVSRQSRGTCRSAGPGRPRRT
jgi:hypothetical protein